MSKNVYSVVNVADGVEVFQAGAFPACRDFCRNFLVEEKNFGVRLQVLQNRTESSAGKNVFDVTSIKYSSGRVRMTLFAEFERQQKLHAATAEKAAARETEVAAKKAAKAEAKAKAKAEADATPKVKKAPKAKKTVEATAKIAAE